jgi:tetratricopeptide (TPR) repeat protein
VARSFSQSGQAPCPACGGAVPLEIWLIVDTAERPDLAARVRDGTLHAVPCPHCGHAGQVDAPLLIHDPGRERVLFAPPQGTTREQDQEIAAQLLDQLAETFLHPAERDASSPRPAYLNQAMAVPHELLPALLDADDPQAALEGILAEATGALERLREEDPEAYRQLEAAARQALGEAAPLLNTLQEFIAADTWGASRGVVEAHPELLSDEADALLTRQAMPIEWATTMMNLANAYSDRIRGDRADNLERAIAAFQDALQVHTREAFPIQWAATQNKLDNALRERIRGQRADNLEHAIAAYTHALEVYPENAWIFYRCAGAYYGLERYQEAGTIYKAPIVSSLTTPGFSIAWATLTGRWTSTTARWRLIPPPSPMPPMRKARPCITATVSASRSNWGAWKRHTATASRRWSSIWRTPTPTSASATSTWPSRHTKKRWRAISKPSPVNRPPRATLVAAWPC